MVENCSADPHVSRDFHLGVNRYKALCFGCRIHGLQLSLSLRLASSARSDLGIDSQPSTVACDARDTAGRVHVNCSHPKAVLPNANATPLESDLDFSMVSRTSQLIERRLFVDTKIKAGAESRALWQMSLLPGT